MDTAEFLARVVAPGNFMVISCARKKTEPGTPFFNVFYPRDELSRAVGTVQWATKTMGWDAYFAVASYTAAEVRGADKQGRAKYYGKRDHPNVQRLKAFWIDLDVKRAGDKKDPANVYATQADAITWLSGFCRATSLPRPNLVVDSGYGLHAYWVLEDALTLVEWQPHADALKAALIAHGFKGDKGISADSARVLRPAGSSNMKSGTAVPVDAVARVSAGDYPNTLVTTALAPYLALVVATPQVQAQAQAQVGATHVLGGGGGAVVQGIFAGRNTPNMATAARANMAPQARPRSFTAIASRCAQVQISLTNHGKGEDRGLWLLGNLTLAHFCSDGADYVHPIGDGDPRYTPAGTDAAVALIAKEHATKNIGPPGCAHYDAQRQGICPACPHHTKIRSPWDLGADDGDLPELYRRGTKGLEVQIKNKDDVFWQLILAGDVHTPILDRLPLGGYALTFTYERMQGEQHIVKIAATTVFDTAALLKTLGDQCLLLSPGCHDYFRGFVLGWIDRLREQRAERTEIIHPFGWSSNSSGDCTGFAVGGTLYTPDGRTMTTPGGDPMLVNTYRPVGTLANWQRAANFVTAGRVDLQVLVAASFGAPLMVFTGHAGLVVSAWSRQSAVGKSSAIKVGQSVWSASVSLNAVDDTNNFVLKKIADVRSMPCYWDEMKVGNDNSDKMVALALSLSQGKGKGRMNADTSLKEVGEWDTILVAASNFPLMDHIVAKTDGTDAGAVRLFEYAIVRDPTEDTSEAARTIALTKHNYGQAGREFAKWLAANQPKADKITCLIKDDLNSILKAEQAERFYVAGMAAILAGARIAKHLGLCNFDLLAMQDFLIEEFRRMRRVREINVVVKGAHYDLGQVMGQFMADASAHKLITERYIPPGKFKIPPGFIKWYPQDKRRVDVHISQYDQIMRIDRAAFVQWCRKRNYPASDIIISLQHVWGADVDRRALGTGTGWVGGQVYAIDIPLTRPELVGYMYEEDTTAGGGTHAASNPLGPKPKPKPNQPKGV